MGLLNDNQQENQSINENEPVMEQTPETITPAVESPKKEQQSNLITIATIVAVVIIVGAIIIGAILPGLSAGKEPVATVGDTVITVDDYQTRVRYYRWQFLQQYAYISQIVQMYGDYDGTQEYQMNQILTLLNTPEQFGQLVLDSMVEETVIQNTTNELGIVVTDEELEKAMEVAFGYDSESEEEASEDALYADQGEDGLSAREEYEQRYQEYMDKFKIADITEEDFLEIQRVILISNALTDELTKDMVFSEDQVWARHILVEDGATALSIIEQLEDGSKTFEELAAELSIDTVSAASGGDLGWFGRGDMIELFEDAAFSLEIGEVSEPIQTDYGYHIIEVLGHEERTMSDADIETSKQEYFGIWLADQVATLAPETTINEEMMLDNTPSEPSLDSPEVIEALFPTTVEE